MPDALQAADSDLEALLETLPPELKKRAVRVLHTWGVAPAEEDSFPVSLALITRLNLWALAKCGIALVTERKAIAELVVNLSLALSTERETRESFLSQFHSAERGEAQRILSLSQQIEVRQAAFLQEARELLRRLRAGADRAPASAPAVPAAPDYPPDATRVHAAAERLQAVAARLDASLAEWERLLPASLPAAVPRSEPVSNEVSGGDCAPAAPVLSRPSAYLSVFLAGFSYAYALHPAQPFGLDLVLTCALPAAVLTIFFLFCLALFPR